MFSLWARSSAPAYFLFENTASISVFWEFWKNFMIFSALVPEPEANMTILFFLLLALLLKISVLTFIRM